MGKQKGGKSRPSRILDGADYRRGALERLDNAWHLLSQERLGGHQTVRGAMTHEQLKEILTRRLRLQDSEFNLEGRGRVSGRVVSATFAGKGDSQRQKMIWDALDAELGAASVREVGMLLAYTPDEWNLQLEGHSSSPRRSSAASRKPAAKKVG